jgi:hypothetical protein
LGTLHANRQQKTRKSNVLPKRLFDAAGRPWLGNDWVRVVEHCWQGHNM